MEKEWGEGVPDGGVPGPTWLASKLAWMGTWAWPGYTLIRARTELTGSVYSLVEGGSGGARGLGGRAFMPTRCPGWLACHPADPLRWARGQGALQVLDLVPGAWQVSGAVYS